MNANYNTGSEKTASVNGSYGFGDSTLDLLAAEFGLNENQGTNEFGSEKVASANLDVGDLFSEYFPDDTFAQEQKTASENDPESALGALTYDLMSDRFSSRIEKIAEEILAEDSTHPQTLENNKPTDASGPINLTPSIMNILPPQNGPEVIGAERNAVSPEMKQAAVRQELLRRQLSL